MLASPTRIADAFTAFLLVERALDGDGDIATTGGYWENAGNGAFATFHPAWSGQPVALADVNGDGQVDVLTFTAKAQATTYRFERAARAAGSSPRYWRAVRGAPRSSRVARWPTWKATAISTSRQASTPPPPLGRRS